MLPLCGSGIYDIVNLPRLFPNAQMPLYACDYDVDKDGYPDIILIYAGEEERTIIKALMPHEFVDELYNDNDNYKENN